MAVLTYAPSHSTPEILDAISTGVVSASVLDTLIEVVRDEIGRKTHQHQIVIGPRGAGKTHILTRMVNRLLAEAETAGKVLPVILAEEEAVVRPAGLFLLLLERLLGSIDRGDAPLSADQAVQIREISRMTLERMRALRDDEAVMRGVAETIAEISRTTGRLVLAVIENLDSILYSGPGLSRKEPPKAHWKLREILQYHPSLLLIASAPTLFGEIQNSGAAFHGFFRMHELGELTGDEQIELLRKRLAFELEMKPVTDERRRARLKALKDGFKEREPHLRGLLVLTGGLPRVCHQIFDIVVDAETSSASAALSRFLNDQTPFFQARLDPRIIPEAELEVIETLAVASGPLSPTEISRAIRGFTPNKVSMCLGRLLDRMLVRRRGSERKNVRYDVAEPLFRVWRRFRIGRSEQEQLLVLAEFVAAIFRPSDLEAEFAVLETTEGLSSRRALIKAAMDIARRKSSPSTDATKLITEEEVESGGMLDEAEREYMSGSLKKAFDLYTTIIKHARARPNKKRLARLLGRYSHIALVFGHVESAVTAAKEGLEMAKRLGVIEAQASCQDSCGDALFRQGKNEEALAAFAVAEKLYSKVGDDLGRGNCLRSRGDVLFHQGKSEEALAAFAEAEKLYSKVGDDLGRGNCLALRGRVATKERKHEEAAYLYNDAFRIFEQMGALDSADLAAQEMLAAAAAALDELAFDSAIDLTTKIASVVGRAAESEEGRGALVQFAMKFLSLHGGDGLLKILPALEGRLSSSQSQFLRPARLAAEVKAGKTPDDLPSEPEEVRRVVREFLRHAGDATASGAIRSIRP